MNAFYALNTYTANVEQSENDTNNATEINISVINYDYVIFVLVVFRPSEITCSSHSDCTGSNGDRLWCNSGACTAQIRVSEKYCN